MPILNHLTDPDPRDLERANRALAVHRDRLLQIPGAHGAATGYRWVNGEVTNDVGVLVYVYQKRPPGELPPSELVPTELRFRPDRTGPEESVRTDVIQEPPPVPYRTQRIRPVPGGYAIAVPWTPRDRYAGTLGGWVWDARDDRVALLSCRHVLGANVGADVFQPLGPDSGNVIAKVVRSSLRFDAAIAAPPSRDLVAPEIADVGAAVFAAAQPTLNMQVEKTGARTGHTTGRVIATHYQGGGMSDSIVVLPDGQQPWFGYVGDSGSLIVNRVRPTPQAKQVVALLWGGASEVGSAYGYPIPDLFADMDLQTLDHAPVAQPAAELVP